LGAITAAGEGAEALWRAAFEGRSAVDAVEFYGANGWRPIGAAVKDFDPEKFISQRKALKVMARDIQLAVAASSLALEDAGLKSASFDHERFGVIVGSGVLNHELDELGYSVQNSLDGQGKLSLKKFGEDGLSTLFPLWLLKYLPNMPACHVSILFDLEGPNNTITTGPSAGMQAVGEAFRIIQRGSADRMLAGGAESKLNPVGLSHYKILGVLSENGRNPSAAYRPFDADAKGIVIGEGAGFLVLEELEHARNRGARIYAEVAGFGSSAAAAEEVAMRAALAEAQIKPSRLGYVQASGLGLEEDDLREAAAIEAVISQEAGGMTRVTASKPVVGFTGFSAGALDIILSALSLRDGAIAPTLNFEKPRRSFQFQIVKKNAVRDDLKNALVNNFGFGGQSASMVLKKWEEN
jgi:3-oxoacyl-[acyl-carrier-protein] synthase II